MFKNIIKELKDHSSYTALGALTGIIILFFFFKIPSNIAYNIFYTLHPLHVLLSAIVTTAIYKIHVKKPKLWALILIGYVGSIGIGTLSDSLIPYLGEILFNLPNAEPHIGFIEEWQIVNPLAFLGILIGFYWPRTKFPHFGHVLLSTWASLFHIILALGATISFTIAILIFVFLFIAVLIPCCMSDIIFPLLFVKKGVKCGCHYH
tara:strand:- start:28 stop:645 length:618 start_codon:yes stop_codon:yes gene_type:complete